MTKAIYICWAIGIAAEILAAIWITRRAGYWWGAVALCLDAGKSIYLMAIPVSEYVAAWSSVRWVHWTSVSVLSLQALWAMVRWWPQGASLFRWASAIIGCVAIVTAGVQWKLLPFFGKGAEMVSAGRAVAVACLAYLAWGRSLSKRLAKRGDMPSNSVIFTDGLILMLSMEVAGAAIVSSIKGNLGGYPAHYGIGIGQMLVTLAPFIGWHRWRKISEAGNDYRLPPTDPKIDEVWNEVANTVKREKDRARRRAAGAWE